MKFRVETNQGTFEIDANREPTAQELQELISSGSISKSAPDVSRETPIDTRVIRGAGDILETPASAIRGGIREKLSGGSFVQGYSKGAQERTETFQDEFTRKAQSFGGESKNVAVNFFKGLPAATLGFAADTLTNPADQLLNVFTGGVLKIGQAGTKAAQALSRVDKSMSKAIRPGVSGKGTAALRKKASSDARLAVDTIVENKAALEFIDEGGSIVRGRSPKNLEELSQAIPQIKKEMYKAYSGLEQQAGRTAQRIRVDDISHKLRIAVSDRTNKIFNKGLIKEADEVADELLIGGDLSVDEAAEMVQRLNNDLTAYYKSPVRDPIMEGRIGLRAIVANNLRKKLDDVVEGATGESYKNFKQRYGALKSIEKEVNNRAVVNARRNEKGIIDFFDIYTLGEIGKGIATQDAGALLKGTIGKTIQGITKKQNDPNFIISKMFSDYERFKKGTTAIEELFPVLLTAPASTRGIINANGN